MTKPKDGAFLGQLEKNIRSILSSHDVTIDQRLKAVEAGARLLLIRHRIEGTTEGEDGKFFSKVG